MSQTFASRQSIGKSILVITLLISFLSLFYVLANMDQSGFPAKFNFLWTASVSLTLLFPIMAAHIYSMWLSRMLGWVSWWLGVTLASVALFWVFAQVRPLGQTYSHEREVVSWFFSAYVGGTFGGLVVFGTMRRFAPSWLGYQKPKLAAEKKKLGIKTMFLWVTTVGFICGAFVNREQLGLIEEHEFHPVFWVPAGAFFMGLFCLFVFPVVTNWLNRAKPFWMAALSLVAVCTLATLGLAVWITIATGFYGDSSSLVSFTYIVFFFCASFIAVLWIAACRWAGLIQQPESSSKSVGIRGFVGRSLGRIGCGLNYVGVTLAVGCLLYIAGWLGVHLIGGPERDPELIHDSIVASLGGTDEDEDWIEVVNREASRGISEKEQNVAVRLLRVLNPFFVTLDPDEIEFRKKSNLSLEINYTKKMAAYIKGLGFTNQEFSALPADHRDIWFEDRHWEFVQQLEQKHTFLADDWFLDEEAVDLVSDQDDLEMEAQDLDGIEANDIESEEPESLSRDEILAKFFVDGFDYPACNLSLAPWKESDYPIGAEFLKQQQSKIQQLREISLGDYYYSPLVRDLEGVVVSMESALMESAFYLLEASANFNTGSDHIDEAIEDCKAISRFARMQNAYGSLSGGVFPRRLDTELALAIAYSEFATVEQIRTLLELVQSQDDVSKRMQSDRRLLIAKIKDGICLQFAANQERPRDRYLSYSDGPILSTYRSFPNLVNWRSLDAELERNIKYAIETSRLAAAGEISYQEYRERSEETCCFVDALGLAISKGVVNSIFGNQFLAFASGPKAKGKLLAQLKVQELEFGGIYSARTSRALDEMGLAIRLYQKANGAYPKSLAALVPSCLQEIPLDPFSGGSFVYKSDGKTFLLYSVGRDQTDDGGDDEWDLVFELPYSDLVDYINRNPDLYSFGWLPR